MLYHTMSEADLGLMVANGVLVDGVTAMAWVMATLPVLCKCQVNGL